MMIDEDIDNTDNKLLDYRLADTEKKIDLVLEQLDVLLRANARLTNLPELIEKSISAALNKRAIQGYSRINS